MALLEDARAVTKADSELRISGGPQDGMREGGLWLVWFEGGFYRNIGTCTHASWRKKSALFSAFGGVLFAMCVFFFV